MLSVNEYRIRLAGGKGLRSFLEDLLDKGSEEARTRAFWAIDNSSIHDIFGIDVDPFSRKEEDGWVWYGFVDNKKIPILRFMYRLTNQSQSIYYETVILMKPAGRRLVLAGSVPITEAVETNLDLKGISDLFGKQVVDFIKKHW